MNRVKPILNPSKKDLLTLRFMIVIGLIAIVLFVWEILTRSPQSLPLYWMLIVTILFTCGRTVHEWIHYFSISVPATPTRSKVFSVDVFTTFCKGEPYEMIEETLLAIKAITYPHQTYLCDESDDPYLKAFCAEHGVHHVTRTLKINAKAGNINNALKISTGELCLVLDPDHVPYPDFLDPIVDHFNDEKIGFVQVVQAYNNAHRSLVAKGAAQQTYQFYGPMMMTMNSYGTVLAIGANCTFRRAALESIGGHAAGLAEDMHTAMQLHAKGWKSLYVPAVLARGLVPSTLSAYYSQQLKWSRGVFDLLKTAYPKLFSNFTWQQKLHYAVVPLHYLSGIIFLINFLIPILSLIFDTSPMNIDFTRFLTLAMPLIGMTFLIRLYVQKWVMEEEERGFHAVGGLLMIGTWWIFILGFVYTLLGKKIPYIPTPKDDTEEDNWHLSVPNFVIIGISLFAICFGLYQDWNPYNLMMSGFALFNCLILGFTILASRQFSIRSFSENHRMVGQSFSTVADYKKTFWLQRRRLYSEVRSKVLFFTLLIVGSFAFILNGQINPKKSAPMPDQRKDLFVPGIFAPHQNDGLTSMKLVNALEKDAKLDFGIVSLYLPWGDAARCALPVKLMDSIYTTGAVPMITWEPWQNLFSGQATMADKKVFQQIVSGRYDAYLDRFSKKIQQLNKPVFIRFAHEADNPQYPWSAAGGNSAAEFKAAWRYVHHFFEKNKAHQVVWVWNPWKPAAVNAYFPGKEYVDWIGVNILDYNVANAADKKSYSMQELYMPFHENPLFRSGLPVMIAELGALGTEAQKTAWLKNALHYRRVKFPEVKSVVLFNSGTDYNTLDTAQKSPYDWRIAALSEAVPAFGKQATAQMWLAAQPFVPQAGGFSTTNRKALLEDLKKIKGVIYSKGKNWTTNGHALKVKEIVSDFEEMKTIGINQVKYYGLNFHDINILRVAEEQHIKVNYTFWIPEDLNFVTDTNELAKFSGQVIEKVKALRDRNTVSMWTIGYSPLSKIDHNYYPPDTYTVQHAYMNWLSKLSKAIKALDPKRPLSIDIAMDGQLEKNIALLAHHVPAIDAYGLVVTNKDNAKLKGRLDVPYFYSSMHIDQYAKYAKSGLGMFLSNWQDEHTSNFVLLDGLKDHLGLRKPAYDLLANHLVKTTISAPLPKVKILLPTLTLIENSVVNYNAIIYKNNQWQLSSAGDRLRYRWELVEYDEYKNPIKVTALGEGTQVAVTIPKDISRYKLHLYVSKQEHVNVIASELNIRLH